MRSTAFLSLLTVATIANARPMDSLDSPAIVNRADDGQYHWQPAAADGTVSALPWQASSAAVPALEATSAPKPVKPAGPSGAAKAPKGGEGSSAPSGGKPSGGSAGSSAYKEYHGNGDNWPKKSAWVGSFDAMFKLNQDLMGISCTQFGTKNNSPAEIQDIKTSVQAEAKSSGVDPRFILAIIMQETKGCTRVPTTNNGVTNPGLMQSHNGSKCEKTEVPCPKSKIALMIKDGTSGTSFGDGLKQTLAKAKGKDAVQVYEAARIYNSGSYKGVDLSDANGATKCYASDVANRLTGWTGATGEGCKN